MVTLFLTKVVVPLNSKLEVKLSIAPPNGTALKERAEFSEKVFSPLKVTVLLIAIMAPPPICALLPMNTLPEHVTVLSNIYTAPPNELEVPVK